MLVILLAVLVLAALAVVLPGLNYAQLNPKGLVADKQRDLLITASLIMLLVLVPVYAMTAWIAWRYREGNKKAVYRPDWDRNRFIEGVWWAVPVVIIGVLSVITWQSSHQLDPFRQQADGRPLTVQVVALQWKWLFIYPEQGVAALNYLRLPLDRPLRFEITADAPMNSFWIPQLGGQIYAMPGMRSQLNLVASQPGKYPGRSANISGEGFSGMTFTAEVISQPDFNRWLSNAAAAGGGVLDWAAYQRLAEPSKNQPAALYSSVKGNLFDMIIAKYVAPPAAQHLNAMKTP